MDDTTPRPTPPARSDAAITPPAAAAHPRGEPPTPPEAARPLRLEIAWLTVVTLAAATLLAALRPAGDGVSATLAGNAADLRVALGGTPSIATLTLLRAQLAADMLFLVAYGLLLGASIQYAHRKRRVRRRAAMAGVIVLMAADATENIAALGVLRGLTDAAGEPEAWWFTFMNAAALLKWAAAGVVLGWLTVAWVRRLRDESGWRAIVAFGIALGFGAGALGAWTIALSWFGGPGRSVAAWASLGGPALAILLQFRLVDLAGVMLRFLYLSRVPLLILSVAAAFGPFALGPAAGLLGGIIDVASWWGIAVLTATSLVLAYACGTQVSLVREYGWVRTFDPVLQDFREPVMARAIAWTAVAAVASLLFATGVASLRLGVWQILGGVITGAVAAALFLLLQELTAAWATNSSDSERLARLPLSSRHTPVVGDLIGRVRSAAPPPFLAALKAVLRPLSPAGRLFGLHSGYIDEERHLLPGHIFATTQFILSMLLYVALLTFKRPAGPEGEPSLWVPTAAAVVLLLMLVSWTLAGVAFFLDRYRWPVFTAFVGVAVVTGPLPWTDHQVATSDTTQRYALATPGGVLGAFERPMIVASAGGGIQAGAWTARALQGIDHDLGNTLHARLALVSAVSGGSMGALYYGAYDGRSLDEATKQSLQPSLDEIGTALIGVDALRLAGVPSAFDRGAALEGTWAQRLPSGGDFSLRAWSERVARVARRDSGVRPFPAFLFNTTVVETGQPMAFATTQFPTEAYRRTFKGHLEQYPVVESANGMFRLNGTGGTLDVGLQAVTAARLSAAFPYVSPAATLNIPGRPRHHMVDGGYYDNYGLAAVSQWLDDALTELETTPKAGDPVKDIDILIVRGLVGSESDLERDLRKSEDEQRLRVEADNVPNRGWVFQATAPPSAFLKTREFGQWAGGNQALRLLQEKWQGRRVNLHVHLFDYPVEQLPQACRLAPLSWKLTVTQQDCVETAWTLASAKAFDTSDWARVKQSAGSLAAP
jgi:hypothetical protein